MHSCVVDLATGPTQQSYYQNHNCSVSSKLSKGHCHGGGGGGGGGCFFILGQNCSIFIQTPN